MKISAVMCTWRRFRCVERALACWLSQDWDGEMELIIYSTDVDNPLSLASPIPGVSIINNGRDFLTGEDYTNTGAIRRDALKFATGTHFICWDDDDLYWPWDVRQRVDGILATGARAWKPWYSWMTQPHIPPFQTFNYLEASVLVEIGAVRAAGFKDASGPEHLAWFDALWNAGQLIADMHAIPGYVFAWGDPPDMAGHKQSGYGANPTPLDNFERHKVGCTDIATRPLERRQFPHDYPAILALFNDALADVQTEKPALFEKYVAPTMSLL